MTAVFRFAPSPNGYLHLGHALSALLNRQFAQAAGGRMLLRIEDIDTARCTPALEAAMLEDLRWIGFAHDEPPRRQSGHFGEYAAALARLQGMGLIYEAYLTRAEIRGFVAETEAQGKPWPRDPDGAPLYPGDAALLEEAEIARRRASGAPFALRLDMRKAVSLLTGPLFWQEEGQEGQGRTVAADPLAWGDVILARKDTPTSYHLSVTLDDALQGVTHVVRGQDLFHATAVHRLLQVLLGLPEPRYHHHRLILGADGRKLSKSEGHTALRALRAAGWTVADVRRRIGI